MIVGKGYNSHLQVTNVIKANFAFEKVHIHFRGESGEDWEEHRDEHGGLLSDESWKGNYKTAISLYYIS